MFINVILLIILEKENVCKNKNMIKYLDKIK